MNSIKSARRRVVRAIRRVRERASSSARSHRGDDHGSPASMGPLL